MGRYVTLYIIWYNNSVCQSYVALFLCFFCFFFVVCVLFFSFYRVFFPPNKILILQNFLPKLEAKAMTLMPIQSRNRIFPQPSPTKYKWSHHPCSTAPLDLPQYGGGCNRARNGSLCSFSYSYGLGRRCRARESEPTLAALAAISCVPSDRVAWIARNASNRLQPLWGQSTACDRASAMILPPIGDSPPAPLCRPVCPWGRELETASWAAVKTDRNILGCTAAILSGWPRTIHRAGQWVDAALGELVCQRVVDSWLWGSLTSLLRWSMWCWRRKWWWWRWSCSLRYGDVSVLSDVFCSRPRDGRENIALLPVCLSACLSVCTGELWVTCGWSVSESMWS